MTFKLFQIYAAYIWVLTILYAVFLYIIHFLTEIFEGGGNSCLKYLRQKIFRSLFTLLDTQINCIKKTGGNFFEKYVLLPFYTTLVTRIPFTLISTLSLFKICFEQVATR